MDPPDSTPAPPVAAVRPRSELLASEDWWSVWIGAVLLAVVAVQLITEVPKPAAWTGNPLHALSGPAAAGIAAVLGGFVLITAAAMKAMARPVGSFVPGFLVVFLLAVAAQVLGAQVSLKSLGLGYALWAIVLGLAVANTVGTPGWLLGAARSELFVKIGLVLLGAKILAGDMVALGAQGAVVAWIVTPVVILFMWHFGNRVVRLSSRTLVMVIACATSVCGVSAAIASAAACRAKKEELTLAVGMTMLFTVGMMVGMPALSRLMGLSDDVAGAWIGGTVDSTGAVAAAGKVFSERAGVVAGLVKMIQNVLIGFVAFFIALYWVTCVERDPGAPRPSPMVIWQRFPKFVLGFLGASLAFSFVLTPTFGEQQVRTLIKAADGLRSWWFTLAFVAIGLESNFRQLARQLVGGKPIFLYVVGQTFNILLTLLAAYLAFGGVLFDAAG